MSSIPGTTGAGKEPSSAHRHHSGCPICQESWQHPTEDAARQHIIDHAADVHGLTIDPVRISETACPVCNGTTTDATRTATVATTPATTTAAERIMAGVS